jgi:site-specific recombinase XerD
MELVLGWHRSPCSLRTAKGYGDVLEQFRQRCQKGYLDEMSRADLVAFIVKKKERVLSSRTIFNRVSNVWTPSSARMGY